MADHVLTDFSEYIPVLIDRLCPGFLRQADLARLLNKDPALINRWKKRKMEAFGTDEGPLLVATLAAELLKSEQSIRSVDHFIDLYWTWTSEARFIGRISNNFLALQPSDRDSPRAMLHLLISLRLLIQSNRWDEAFLLGWNFWPESGHRHPSINYRLRMAISEAKEHLSSVERHQIVERVGKELLNLTEPRRFVDEYSPIASQPYMTPSEIPLFKGVQWEYLTTTRRSRSRFAHCKSLDDLFQTEAALEAQLECDYSTFEVPPEWHEFAWLALDKAFQGAADIFESSKVRFSHVDLPDLSRGIFKIGRTTYLRDVVTTQALPIKFKCNSTGRIVGLTPTPSVVRALSSDLGNSFFLLTRDHHLVVRYKSRRNRFLNEAIVPFGGIVDFVEHDQGQPKTLFELLARSSKRKVWEQCQVKPSEQEYVVLGLTLDLKYGLKPDCFGVSIVNLDFRQLVERFEPVYGHKPASMKIDFSSHEQFEESVTSAAEEWDGTPFLDENITLLKGAYSLLRVKV